jgi:hypothetical protein
MLSLLSLGVNHENWLILLVVTCESSGSKQEDVDDGAGMHKYLFCTIYLW